MPSKIGRPNGKAEDPEYIPQVQLIIPCNVDAMVTAFIDQILPGVNEHYACRHKGCSTTCRNVDWAFTAMDGHFRCPTRAEQYRPWMSKPGYWKANKVIAVDASATGSTEAGAPAAPLISPVIGSTEDKGNNRLHIYAITWTDTATTSLIKTFKVICNNLETEMQDVPPEERVQWVFANLPDPSSSGAYMHHRTLSDYAKKELDRIHSIQFAKPYNYKHFLEHVYWAVDLSTPAFLTSPCRRRIF